MYSRWEFDFASVLGTEHQFTEMGICHVEQLQREDLDVAKNFCPTLSDLKSFSRLYAQIVVHLCVHVRGQTCY